MGGAAFATKPPADAGAIESPTQQVIADAGCCYSPPVPRKYMSVCYGVRSSALLRWCVDLSARPPDCVTELCQKLPGIVVFLHLVLPVSFHYFSTKTEKFP